jgi:hypothetical protein
VTLSQQNLLFREFVAVQTPPTYQSCSRRSSKLVINLKTARRQMRANCLWSLTRSSSSNVFVALHESGFDAVDGLPGTGLPKMWALLKLPRFGGASMQTITTIGLDIAKSVS